MTLYLVIMSHDHNKDSSSLLSFGLIINSAYTVVEFVAGILTGSLALIADATHNLTDTVTLLISHIGMRLARKSPNTIKTFGYGRATIVSALLNAGILVAVALFIGYEAIERLGSPSEVPGGVVAAVSAIGIAVNGSIAWQLSKNKTDLNIKSAYTNMFYDTLSSVGALIGGVVILLTGWNSIDTIIGVGIAAMLLIATAKLIREAIHLLLEGVPVGYDVNVIQNSLLELDGVEHIDDLHVWAISTEYVALSCHVVLAKGYDKQYLEVVDQVKSTLHEKHDINHSTIEVEKMKPAGHIAHTA